jgi:uridine kinase
MTQAGDGNITRIVKRNGTVVPFDRDRIATAIFKAAASVGGSDRALADRLALMVEQALIATYGANSIPTVEDIQDVVEETLIEEGHAKTARAYILYRARRAEAREARSVQGEFSDNIPYKKIYDVLRWNMDHGCDSVEGINRIIAQGRYADLVHAVEKRYDDEVALGADQMLDRIPGIRMVIIAGPSSSGKTTTTIKVSEKLKAAGMRLKAINVDHYFYDLEMHPKDEFGDYDYETPQALDLELINQHLVQLLEGRTIKTPHYDFKTGKRTLHVHELKIEKNEIVLIDSLHGLYDAMTHSIPPEQKFRLYIETLGQVRSGNGVFMRWADNRLMRRMIRDSWHRNLQPLQTLTHWHYVRRSELRNIIPFISAVDYLVNSAMPHELPIMKNKLFKFFPDAIAQFKDEPKRQDAYIRAKRVYDLLNELTEMPDDGTIPEKSLLREFIGGSQYHY